MVRGPAARKSSVAARPQAGGSACVPGAGRAGMPRGPLSSSGRLKGSRLGCPNALSAGSSDLWAGLFDLRENLLNGALEDLRALAA